MLLRLEEKIRRDSAWASPFLQFELIPGNCSLSVAAVSSSDPLVAVFLRPLSDFRYPLIFILFFQCYTQNNCIPRSRGLTTIYIMIVFRNNIRETRDRHGPFAEMEYLHWHKGFEA